MTSTLLFLRQMGISWRHNLFNTASPILVELLVSYSHLKNGEQPGRSKEPMCAELAYIGLDQIL